MAMTDYFKKEACQKVVQTKTANAYGNYTVTDAVTGAKFDGLLVKRAISEDTVGAQRTSVDNKYNLFVYDSTALVKDDKVCFTYRDGRKAYLRLTSDAILNDERSGQTAWKTYECETYEPTGSVG